MIDEKELRVLNRRISFVLASILCLVLVCCACQSQPKSEGESGTTTDVPTEESTIPGLVLDAPLPERTAIGNMKIAAAKTINLDAIEPYFDEQDMEVYDQQGGLLPVGAFCDNLVFDQYGVDPVWENRSNNLLWGYYDIDKQKTQSLGEVGMSLNLTSWQHSVIMHGTDYYCVWNNGIDPQNTNIKLFKVSAKDNIVKEMKTIESATVFTSLEKLDEDHFLYHTYTQREDGVRSTVYKYDCNTETETIFLTEDFVYTNDDHVGDGLYFERLTVSDGTVYAFFRTRVGTEDHMLLRLYDAYGMLQKEINADVVFDYIDDSTILNLIGNGNYFFMNSYASYSSGGIFRLTDTGLELLAEENSAFDLFGLQLQTVMNAQNVYSSEKCGYIPFQLRPRDSSTGRAKDFYLLNTANGMVTHFDVQTSKPQENLTQVYIDEYGNLILRMSQGSSVLSICYRIDHADLQQNLA